MKDNKENPGYKLTSSGDFSVEGTNWYISGSSGSMTISGTLGTISTKGWSTSIQSPVSQKWYTNPSQALIALVLMQHDMLKGVKIKSEPIQIINNNTLTGVGFYGSNMRIR